LSGWAIWITGLPGSGKSTIAEALKAKLEEESIPFQLLSMDELRKILTPKPSYSEEERDRVYSALSYIAELLTQNGVNVVIDATGNRRKYRDKARERIRKFIEVYVKCPIEVCIRREMKRRETHGAPKGIYAKAFKGESLTVPGVGAPYEEPLNPEVTVDSTKLTPSEAAEKIMVKIKAYRGGEC